MISYWFNWFPGYFDIRMAFTKTRQNIGFMMEQLFNKYNAVLPPLTFIQVSYVVTCGSHMNAKGETPGVLNNDISRRTLRKIVKKSLTEVRLDLN